MGYQALIKDTRTNQAIDLVFTKEALEKRIKELKDLGFEDDHLFVWEMDADDPSGS